MRRIIWTCKSNTVQEAVGKVLPILSAKSSLEINKEECSTNGKTGGRKEIGTKTFKKCQSTLLTEQSRAFLPEQHYTNSECVSFTGLR